MRTTILARRGVEKVRILSESGLTSLLRAGEGAPAAPGNGGSGGRCASARDRDAPGRDAAALRALRESAIGAIETRVGRLSIALEAVACGLERIERACPAGEHLPAPGGLDAVQRHLLREMLL